MKIPCCILIYSKRNSQIISCLTFYLCQIGNDTEMVYLLPQPNPWDDTGVPPCPG